MITHIHVASKRPTTGGHKIFFPVSKPLCRGITVYWQLLAV